MLWLAQRELIARPTASVLVCIGLLLATLGFTLGASTLRATEAQLTGDITRGWGGPYHLLVRPRTAVSAAEIESGRVRPNASGGLAGGITLDQLASIRGISGVEVAAPLAIVGFVRWPTAVRVELPLARDDIEVLRVSATATADAGLSTYDLGTTYAVYARSGTVDTLANQLTVGGRVISCARSQSIWCFAERATIPSTNVDRSPVLPTVVVDFAQPILIAGVDPEAEAALVGLDRCVTAGRALTNMDAPVLVPLPNTSDGQTLVPILVSERSFVDEVIRIKIARALDTHALLTGASPTSLPVWTDVETRTVPGDDAYRDYLSVIPVTRIYNPSPLWSPGDVHYEVIAGDHLRATTVEPDMTVFDNPLVIPTAAAQLAPPEATDVWVRPVDVRTQLRRAEPPNSWTAVGRYDPGCLTGFESITGGNLDAYVAPSVFLPDGRTLGPTRSIAGYVNAPPLILTTLAGAAWFADPSRFEGALGAAFISAVRVRITGVQAFTPAAEARLARAAAAIHEATGLMVDVVVGSSPEPVRVDLPGGKYGRPELSVTEGWSVKGVVVRFVEAISAQNVALFSVMLSAALVLVGETAVVSVRRRRREFAVLRALGWNRWHIVRQVLTEMLLLGGATGALTIVTALVLAFALHLGVTGWQIAAIVPLALTVALAGAAIPALSAVRFTPVRNLSGQGDAPSRTGIELRGPASLGMRDLMGAWRLESALGAGVVALGAVVFGIVLVVSSAFANQLDATVLGTQVAIAIRPFHVVLAILTLLVGSFAAAQLITLGYLERQEQFAVLRAVGWTRHEVERYVAAQTIALGVGGGGLGAAAVLAVGLVLQANPTTLVLAVLGAWFAAAAATALAAAVPLRLAHRLQPGIMLRGE